MQQDSAWIFTNQTESGGASFHTAVSLVNEAAAGSSTVQVRTTIRDASGVTVATQTSPSSDLAAGAARSVVVSATLASGAKHWSVQSPHLYTAAVEVLQGAKVIDSLNITTGVRSVRFDADEGEPSYPQKPCRTRMGYKEWRKRAPCAYPKS